MQRFDFVEFSTDLISNVATWVYYTLLAASRRIYRRAGIVTPFLRRYWHRSARHLQTRLNIEHRTKIEYGYIKSF